MTDSLYTLLKRVHYMICAIVAHIVEKKEQKTQAYALLLVLPESVPSYDKAGGVFLTSVFQEVPPHGVVESINGSASALVNNINVRLHCRTPFLPKHKRNARVLGRRTHLCAFVYADQTTRPKPPLS